MERKGFFFELLFTRGYIVLDFDLLKGSRYE